MDAVLFDLFDTLVSGLSAQRWEENHRRMAAHLGVDEDRFLDVWQAAFRERMIGLHRNTPHQFEQVLDQMGHRATRSQIQAASDTKRRFLESAITPKPDAIATLEALAERGLSIGLVSDISLDAAEILEAHPLGGHFEVRAYSARLGTRKPDPRMYNHALDGLGVQAERSLYVGDGNSHELLGARKLGLTTVWVDNGQRQQFKERWSPDGDHSIRNLSDLLPIVDELLAGP